MGSYKVALLSVNRFSLFALKSVSWSTKKLVRKIIYFLSESKRIEIKALVGGEMIER